MKGMYSLTACYVLVQSTAFQVLHWIAVPFEEPRILRFLCFGIQLPRVLPIPPSMTMDCNKSYAIQSIRLYLLHPPIVVYAYTIAHEWHVQ